MHCVLCSGHIALHNEKCALSTHNTLCMHCALCSGRVTRGSQADQSTCILSKPPAWLIIIPQMMMIMMKITDVMMRLECKGDDDDDQDHEWGLFCQRLPSAAASETLPQFCYDPMMMMISDEMTMKRWWFWMRWQWNDDDDHECLPSAAASETLPLFCYGHWWWWWWWWWLSLMR